MEGSGNTTAPWRRQGSSGSGGSTPTTPATMTSAPAPPNGPAPPPPPPMSSGPLPSVRLSSEVGPLQSKGPPLAIQGAMMKDKKPFTYTPGGLDLFSEIKSPRMAKRIQMNAAAEGVTSVPQSQPNPNAPPHYLPPASLAAMQPQMPISVLPQGGFNPSALLRGHNRPNDFAHEHTNHQQNHFQPPPPPPPQRFSAPEGTQQFIPPPPPPQRFSVPEETSQPSRFIPPPPPQQRFSAPEGTPQPMRFTPPQPPPPPQQDPRPTYINANVQTPPKSMAQVMTQSIRLPPTPAPPPPSAPAAPQVQPTKAQTVSQNIGSIYIPPLEQPKLEQNVQSQPPHPANYETGRRSSFEAVDERDKSSSNTPQTPQLNKAPTPWMNSRNRIQNQAQNSPPFLGGDANSNTTPWGTLNSMPGRMIPITIAREDIEEEEAKRQPVRQVPRGFPFQPNMASNAGQNVVANDGSRTIPIQMEGSNVNVQRIPANIPPAPQTPQSAGAPGPFWRKGPVPYNNPSNMYSPQAAQDAFRQMQTVGLQGGVNKIVIDDEIPKQDPTQSKSFRVIQKITDDDSAQQQRKLQLTEEDKQLMDTIKSKVDDGSSLHNTTEPRFRGSNIPSRAFRTLQNNLPPNPDNQEQSPSATSQRPGNPVTHTIKIRMPDSPDETQQQQQRIPASQQKTQEPKMYMGGNIPSRSFKMLQAMTGESGDQINASGSDVGPDQMNNSTTTSSQEYPYDSDSSQTFPYSLENQDDPNLYYYDPENYPEYYDPNYNWEGWDAYSYWYYWWYYANYWNNNGQPMEYPEGWENYQPYYESDYEDSSTPSPAPICIPSKSFRNLQKSVDGEFNEVCQKKDEIENPTMIVEKEEKNSKKGNNCDEIGLKREKPGDWNLLQNNNNNKSKVETERRGRNEETEDESPRECDSYASSPFEGIVDEPATSEDDTSTLTEETPPPIVIEECFSEPESPSPFSPRCPTRLSTIDELSENEISQTPTMNLRNRHSKNIFSEEENDEESSSDSSSSEEDNSSASVIENKSGECMSATTNNTTTTTTSGNDNGGNESSSSDEEMDVDENENFQQSTVTVRLPLRLSFSKSKSYRDIATVLIGDSQVETDGSMTSQGSKGLGKGGGEILGIRETSEDSSDSSSGHEPLVPVSNFTITVSRKNSNEEEKVNEKVDQIEEDLDNVEEKIEGIEEIEESEDDEVTEKEEDQVTETPDTPLKDDLDFWGELINKSTESETLKGMNAALVIQALDSAGDALSDASSVDFWKEIETKDSKAKEKDSTITPPSNANTTKSNSNYKPPEVNFWEKQEILTNCFNFIDSHRSFELTEDYHRETANKAMQLLISSESDEKSVGVHTPEMINEFESEARDVISESNGGGFWEISDEDEESKVIRPETISGNEDESDKGNEVDGSEGKTAKHNPGDEGRNPSSPPKSRKAARNDFRPVESPHSLSVSDETSDESSSRSSGTTIGRQDKSNSSLEGNEESGKKSSSLPKEPTDPNINQVPIKLISETLDSRLTTERVARAESLLWRIEKFLQESLCLGSEDDSGFMTDFSRPISECETDYDAENEGVSRKPDTVGSTTVCSEQIKEEKVSVAKVVETLTKTKEEKVTMRSSTAAGRKALSYQRAKTHSRLFQLLQEECGREEDEEDGEINEEPPSPVKTMELVPIKMESEEAKAARGRLMTPLPIKTNFPTTTTPDSNSTSSPSGSSGVLSPTSPAQRDQLLADIINEFHLRVTTDSAQKTLRSNVNFPSKIFKLLQTEFGEEFYDTFHRGDDLLSLPILPLPQIQVQEEECSLEKSETKKPAKNYRKIKENSLVTAKPSSLKF